MDEEIRKKLSIEKIRNMKKPTILMNKDDFDDLKKEIDPQAAVVVGTNTTYTTDKGVPIKTSQFIDKGNIIVYDDAFNN